MTMVNLALMTAEGLGKRLAPELSLTQASLPYLMEALAARRARVNAVGVVGLVENMPSGTATRPGDIVISDRRRR